MPLDEKETIFNALKISLKESSEKLGDIQQHSFGSDLVKINSLMHTADLYSDYCTEILNNTAIPLTRSINERAEQIQKFCHVIEKLGSEPIIK